MKYYLTGKQAQAIDKYTQTSLGISGITLMESAAKKLAETIDAAIKVSSKIESESAEINKVYDKPEGFDKLKSFDKLEDFEKLSRFNKSKDKIISIVESGNNGGDAVTAAWMLKDMGYDTYIYEINGISRKTESYLTEVKKAKERNVPFVDIRNDEGQINGIDEFKVVIDGIFGVGLTRDVTGVQAEVVDAINSVSSTTFVVGVDIPSGISADTGHVLGTAVRCDMTVTFEYTKYGMLLGDGREYSGDIICENIGLYVPEDIKKMAEVLGNEGVFSISKAEMTGDSRMTQSGQRTESSRTAADNIYICHEYEAAEVARIIPIRKGDSNKGTYGKVLIVAGSKDIYGAVYMAAEAAYRVGAGLVKVVTDIRNRDILCDKLPEAMMLTYDTDSITGDGEKGLFRKKSGAHFEDEFVENFKASVKWADVILAGPGLGTSEVSKQLMGHLADSVKEGQKLILDADALNIISSDSPHEWFKSFTSKLGIGNVIITPHMMEMLRIVKAGYNIESYEFMLNGLGYTDGIQFLKDYRKSQAYNLAYNEGIIVVLKDARTVVAFRNINDDEPGMKGCGRECPIYINTSGNSGMSKGGSGDVLAGMIAGLLAQYDKEESNQDKSNQNKSDSGDKFIRFKSVSDIVCAAVNLHGRAGDKAREEVGEYPMMARDIIKAISLIMKK